MLFSLRNGLRYWAGPVCLLAAILAPIPANAARTTRVWNTDDGLLNDNVAEIVQGGDNYLWVVPPVGLMRFDGINFSRFPIEKFTRPGDNHICAALRDRTGILWLGTRAGTVVGLKPDLSAVTIPKSALPAERPLSLAEDHSGSLWLAYASVICRFSNGQATRFGTNEGMPANKFQFLSSDGAGNIWLAKGNQIRVFRNGQFRQVAKEPDLRGLTATSTNAVWLLSGTNLFTCTTDGILRNEAAFRGLSRATGRGFLADHTGAVWIGTDGNGLIRYSESGFEKVDTSYPSILSLVEDSEGNVWVGTGGDGLNRVSLSGVALDVLRKNPVLEQVQSICEDTNGTLWGATYDGALVSRIDNKWTPVFTNAPFAGNVTCVAADRGGTVWIGTRIGKFASLAGTNYTVSSETTLPIIRAFLPASNGDLWIIGNHFLQRLHNGQLTDVKLPRWIEAFTAIAEDTAGNIWMAARDTIMRFDGKKFKDQTSRLPILGHSITCIYPTADGSVWLSGGGAGLLRLKDGKVDQIGIEQGLFDDYISQIVMDGRGWFWFGSDRGIFKIRRHQLEQAMNDRNVRLHPVVYGRNEGLSSLTALVSTGLPFAFPRAISTRDGRVWLLTHTGVLVADPALVREYSAPPPVLLTGVAMDGRVIASDGSIASAQTVLNLQALNAPLRLPPGYRHLKFDFTAFHFSAPENLHFRYQLAGFDNDWIDSETKRSADYSRLTTGNYEFRVQACTGDGPWSESPAAFAFSVAPFFWETWWFRLSTLVFFTASVIAIVRYISFRRLRLELRAAEQQAAIERERGRIARDLHDDLGNQLTKIQLLTGMAQRDGAISGQAASHVQQISSTIRQATDALDEIVWAINPHNNTLTHLIDYLGQFAVDFLRAAGIRCRVDLPDHPPLKPVSAEVRHNLFLAVKESLNNIVHHSHATEVSLIVLVTEESISVIIEDNGCGFNGEAPKSGADGLHNMRQRMLGIGGQFQIKSAPGSGTCISFNGPWLARE